jgi:hypothetical protein
MRLRTRLADWTNTSLRNRLTIGVLVLSAIGFIGAGVGSQALLRNYLIHQVDDQLISVIGGTAERLDRVHWKRLRKPQKRLLVVIYLPVLITLNQILK